MKEDLNNALITRYPLLLRECTDSHTNLKVRCRGCECGDGWYLIIEAFCEQLMAPLNRAERDLANRTADRERLDEAGIKLNADERRRCGDTALTKAEQEYKQTRRNLPAIVQIKEKFGALSIHRSRLNDTSRALIGMRSIWRAGHASSVAVRRGHAVRDSVGVDREALFVVCGSQIRRESGGIQKFDKGKRREDGGCGMRVNGIDAICFDAFGTLVEIADKRNPYGNLFNDLGIRSAEAIRLAMTMNADVQDVLTTLGVNHVPEEIKRTFLADLKAEVASVRLLPNAADVLRQLRAEKYQLWVASNLAAPYGMPLIETLSDYVDEFSLSYLHSSVKPESAIFAHVCEGLGTPANRILMIGDNPKNDVDGARKFGMRAETVPAEGISIGWLRKMLGTEGNDGFHGS